MQRTTDVFIILALTILGSGCLDRDLEPLNPCLVSGVVADVTIEKVDKVDLLFVVDDSKSMEQEQAALEREFPKLIRALTTGDRDGDGTQDFAPAKDLHLGVVSSDLGLPGIPGVDKCVGLGEDGLLQSRPAAGRSECAASYPPFLTYRADVNDPDQVARDFACIAALGTDGCGFEQQLEAGLKALWPAQDHDPETGAPLAQNRIRFVSDPQGFGAFGHGDGDNAGFLRTDPAEGLSVLAVIVVTDEEDCSSHDLSHLVPDYQLSPDDPRRQQDMNLRCFYNKDNLYALDRYVNGLRALRPGNEHLVVFGAIAGVPEDLVNARAREAVHFDDDASRNAYYDRILTDPRMVEQLDPDRAPGDGNLVPSCKTSGGKAYPPRRIVEVARAFEENGIVQSICQDDFGPAMDTIVDKISGLLGSVCPPRKLVRDVEGKVNCQVRWELPATPTSIDTPTSCSQRSFLEAVEGDTRTCGVAQLPVLGGAVVAGDVAAEGWYYDDFSPEILDECRKGEPQRIAFTAGATPPTGVNVRVECLDERQTLTSQRTDTLPGVEHPKPGTGCDHGSAPAGMEGDAACEVRLVGPTDQFPDAVDRSMFCHPQRNVCVLSCEADGDCPAAWVCDDRPETLRATQSSTHPNGRALCMNPTCGSE